MDKLGKPASTPCPALGAQLRLRGARGGRGRAASGTVGSRRDFGPPGALERRERLASAAMEDEKSFSDICGGRVVLRRRYYSPYCREFGLSSARLSLRSLTAVTCAVWLAAYGLFTLCEVKAGARPSQAAAFKSADPWGPGPECGDLGPGSHPAAGLFSLSGWLPCSSPVRTSSENCQWMLLPHARLTAYTSQRTTEFQKGALADTAVHVCVQEERTVSS